MNSYTEKVNYIAERKALGAYAKSSFTINYFFTMLKTLSNADDYVKKYTSLPWTLHSFRKLEKLNKFLKIKKYRPMVSNNYAIIGNAVGLLLFQNLKTKKKSIVDVYTNTILDL